MKTHAIVMGFASEIQINFDYKVRALDERLTQGLQAVNAGSEKTQCVDGVEKSVL